MHKTTSSAILVLKFVLQFNNSYLNQFSSISGGNCINPVRAESVCDEILAVTKVFTSVGLLDPWFTTLGHMDLRLTTLYASYKNADPAPTRVKPLPIQVLDWAQAIILPSPLGQTTIDMVSLAFFFLLRPGEYCAGPDNHPFTLPMSPYSSGPLTWISSRPPPPICTEPPTSPLPLTTRKIANAARSLLMATAATPSLAPS